MGPAGVEDAGVADAGVPHAVADVSGVGIEVVAAPIVNYAMAHGGIAFLHRIVVTVPPTVAGVDDLVIHAEVVDAQGDVLTRPWQHHVDSLRSGIPLVVDHPAIRLDARYLAELEEETTAEVVVTVTSAGRELGRAYTPVRVLAARQWSLDPSAPVLSLELLASFVQPNHPAVGPVVARAAAILADRTKSGSLQVTYVDPERIDAIVDAVFTAVHELDVYYAEPPASWGYGQKVRTPGDVFEQRVGTCLDTTIALASCLEHVGITPVVWVARGHAFLGYWRRSEQGLPDAASLQIAPAANAVDLGLMGVVETTMVTRERRPPKDLFRRASQAPKDGYFLGGSSELVGVVDVGMARLMRVLPVPARRVRADGVVELVEYTPPDPLGAAVAATRIPEPSPGPDPRPRRPDPPPRVQAWKNALLDLTLRNRLLNLAGPMTQAPLVTPSEQLGLLAQILQEGKTVSIRAVDDLAGAVAADRSRDAYALPGDVLRNMLASRSTIYSGYASDVHKAAMTRLRYRARTAIQETGANPLYVTLGRLDWQLGDRDLSAPLLLAPVQVKGVVMPFRIAFDESGAVTLNHSLMEKLRLEFGFTVSGLTEQLPTLPGTEHVDVGEVVRRVREAIAASGLPFRVESEARLAVIAFTGYLLWRDLDAYWERFLERPLVRHLALSPTDSFAAGARVSLGDADLDDVVATAPVPTDGSQAEAIAGARAGQTFVLEGPPGTGKSQTITAILADQMAQGRRVLFVAEKGAALDVVRNRLGEVGLLPFALDLHDEGARPTEVRARLRTALQHRAQPDTDGYRMAASDVSTSGSVLEAYASRLHQRNGAGLSLYTARGQQLARGRGAVLPVPEAAVVDGAVSSEALRRAVADAVPALSALPRVETPVWGFARSRPGDLSALWASLDAADDAVGQALRVVDTLPTTARGVVEGATTSADLGSAVWLLSASSTDPSVSVEARSDRWRAAREELWQRTREARETAASLMSRFTPEVASVDVEPVRQAVREASTSFVIGRKGRLVRAAAPVLAHLRPGAEVDPKTLPAVVEEVARVRRLVGDLALSWRRLPGCAALDPAANVLSEAGWQAVSDAVSAVERDRDLLAGLPTNLSDGVQASRRFGEPLGPSEHRTLDAAGRALSAAVTHTGGSSDDEARFARGRGLLRTWAATAAERRADRPRGAALGRWVEASEALAPLGEALGEARWALLTGAVSPDDGPEALDRGLAAASVAERWDAAGFGSFEVERQDRTVSRFVDASERLRSSLATALPAALLDRRPFRPGAFFGKVGALEREIGRTRGGLSVRRLVQEYGEVIGAITPCVLVSPDSLARFVPPGSMSFDLVVFDEASQITVADAVGALGRADAAVIAGDSKQMPPSVFAELSMDDADAVEAEFQVVPDEESILTEAVHAGVGRLWLSWHYRSQDESLIAFSNAAYYENRLSSFPAHPAQSHDTGVSFTRVAGTFLRTGRGAVDKGALRTNPVEAAAVVAEVLRRWQARERSIGVVTFNIQQRALIESMLEESGVDGLAEALAAKRDGLFVKNLENVQGDERDVILFSTGFSANADGVLPLNFGPLNRSGGERRLNVAVTRARRRVMVFSSFEPEDLRVEQTSSVGIRDLRRYLEVAKYGVATTPAAVSTGQVGIDRHRDDIAAALRSAGLDVATAVGLSEFQIDLTVAPRGEPMALAVLLDSPAWAERRTTSDRDALPVVVLERIMGWPKVVRVWLPDWLEDRDSVVARLVVAAGEAAAAPRQVGERVVTTSPGMRVAAESPQDVVGAVDAVDRGRADAPRRLLRT